MVISGCPEGLTGKGRCEHKLAGSGGVSQTDILGKRGADGGNSWSLRPECARRIREEEGYQGGWRGGDTGQSHEGKSAEKGGHLPSHLTLQPLSFLLGFPKTMLFLTPCFCTSCCLQPCAFPSSAGLLLLIC